MNAKTELDVLVPNLPRKRKLPGFYHSRSSNDSFHNDHPKKLLSVVTRNLSYYLKLH